MTLAIEKSTKLFNDYNLLNQIFRLFHYIWLTKSYLKKPQLVIKILSAVHGHSLSHSIQENFLASDFICPNAEVAAMISKRKQIQAMKEQLNLSKNELLQTFKDELKDSIIHSLNKSETPTNTKGRSLCKDLHDKISSSHSHFLNEAGEFNPTAPFYSMHGVENLKLRLANRQSLLIFVDAHVCIDGLDIKRDADEQYDWILNPDGKAETIKLSLNMDKCTEIFIPKSKAAARIYDIQYGNSTESKPISGLKFVSDAERQAYLKQNLWDVITAKLDTNTESIAIVSNGRFHLFPFEIDKPQHLQISYYIGLAFFANDMAISVTHRPNDFFVMPNDDETLLFSNHESELLKTVWATNKNACAVDITKGQRLFDNNDLVSTLHVAGHGFLHYDHKTMAFSSNLKLDENHHIDDAFVFANLPAAEVVWISSCVLGQIWDDEQNEPAGIVLPFLLKGAKAVIASMVAVPDTWMPLLVSMTEWLRQQFDLSPDNALQQAKRALPTWADNPRFAKFKLIYAQWLKATLYQVIERRWNSSGMKTELNKTADRNIDIFMEWFCDERDIALTEEQISHACPDNNRLQDWLDNIVIKLLFPPKNVCDLLSHAVKLFSNNYTIQQEKVT